MFCLCLDVFQLVKTMPFHHQLPHMLHCLLSAFTGYTGSFVHLLECCFLFSPVVNVECVFTPLLPHFKMLRLKREMQKCTQNLINL